MSENNFNNGNKNDEINNIGIQFEYKYYNENESINVTYEDIDTCNNIINEVSHSRGRDIINDINNNNVNNNNVINPNHNQSNNAASNNQPNQANNENSSNNNNANYNNINYLLDNSLNNYSSADYILNNNEDFSESNNNRNFDTQLDEIFDQLTYAIRNEKQNLKNEKLLFLKDKQKFIDFKNNEKYKLEKEKEQYKENLKIIENINIKDSDILDLDIGGTQKITTSRNTLIKVDLIII